jgi:transcriptional/translational regulatory protein YebC/TACO1
MKSRQLFLTAVMVPVLATALAACTTTASRGEVTSYFNDKGQLEILSSSYREDWALQLAVNRGNATCEKSGKTFAVINRQSRYQGVNQDVKAAMNMASSLTGGKVPYTRSSSRDWQVTVIGECR